MSHAWALAEDAGHLVVDGEASLCARLREGERAAIDEVYRSHYDAVRAFAHRFVGDAQTAEDVVHDVFIALPAAIRRFRGDSRLRTFLCAIALRCSYKHVRSARRRRAAMGRFAEQPAQAAAAPPDSALGRKQLAAVLYDALDRLPRDQRTAFVLCEIDQMTAVEAAAIVDAPEATVRTRLFHARRKLRELLASQGAR
ncbi:MAG TPA: sigma-70 family RNA polymerase sigma factor [Kofleriaceae bacterium]|nr:sigma-70 family RNA polymerase sigma factor [Kofleriaceae bacterium]